MREASPGPHPSILSVSEFEWYARPELAGPWILPACAEHGRSLERHRFRRQGPTLDRPGLGIRTAERCDICRDPSLLEEVERCECEHDPARCPVHQNVGCGG